MVGNGCGGRQCAGLTGPGNTVSGGRCLGISSGVHLTGVSMSRGSALGFEPCVPA